jgi:AcrR family transcriptional regulator
MPVPRSDAVRSRARILDAAAKHATSDLRLNEVAREAGVGVATVYRHFPTVLALVEALTAKSVERLLELSREAASSPDASAAFGMYLRSALALQLDDDGLQTILLSPEGESIEMRAAKAEIFATAASLLQRAQDAGVVRPDVTLDQLEHLVCGIEHAVRLGDPGDRSLLMDVLLDGLRPL